jgi:transcriptional regulator with XRE-family HTH domain
MNTEPYSLISRTRPSTHSPLGPMIGQILLRSGMSKAEFARRIHISRQHVSALLEKESMDTEQLWRIGIATGVNMFQILSEEFDPEKAKQLRKNLHLHLEATENQIDALLQLLQHMSQGNASRFGFQILTGDPETFSTNDPESRAS